MEITDEILMSIADDIGQVTNGIHVVIFTLAMIAAILLVLIITSVWGDQ